MPPVALLGCLAPPAHALIVFAGIADVTISGPHQAVSVNFAADPATS
jgi:TRAP-type C4-dicarboxylate transport system permease large subunit